MKIVCSAFDVGPRNCLDIIVEEANRRGHEAVLLPREKDVALTHSNQIQTADTVIIGGPASFETKVDTAVMETAEKAGVGVVVVEDSPGSSLRPGAKSVLFCLPNLILAHPADKYRVAAEQFGYFEPQYFGLPTHWRKDCEEIRAAAAMNICRHGNVLRGGDSFRYLGADDDTIGFIGTKDPAANNKILKLIIEAVGDRYTVVFGQHPGEKAEGPEDERLFAERAESLRLVDHVDTNGLNGAQVVALSDISVYAGGSTLSIAGAMLRRPQIYWEDDEVMDRLRVQGIADGHWFVAELGGALKVTGHAAALREAIEALMPGRSGLHKLWASQLENFPMPLEWDTEVKVVDFLEQNFG